jgi:hypothetical protein
VTGPEVGATSRTIRYLGEVTAYAVAVDDENLYWSQPGSIMQAPKAGGGTPVVLGFGPQAAFVIRTGGDYVYWLSGGLPARVPRFGKEPPGTALEELTIGGVRVLQRTGLKVEAISLPWASAETLVLDEKYAYVAMPGCGAVVLVDLETLAQTTLTLEEPPKSGEGRTYMARDGADVYCAAWHSVFAIRDRSRLELVASGAEHVAGVTVAGGRLYWLDMLKNQDGTNRGEMWALGTDGTPVRRGDPYVSQVGPYEIFADDARQRIVWVDTAVVQYDTANDNWRAWTLTSFAKGDAIDDSYLYWARAAPGNGFATIERMPLDEP